jgi:hypothetical protein
MISTYVSADASRPSRSAALDLHLRGRRRGDPAALPRRRRGRPARELVVVEALHAHCTGRGAREIREDLLCLLQKSSRRRAD